MEIKCARMHSGRQSLHSSPITNNPALRFAGKLEPIPAVSGRRWGNTPDKSRHTGTNNHPHSHLRTI